MWQKFEDFFSHLFPLYRRRISQEQKHVLTGIYTGKIDIISIGSPRPFPLATVTEKGQVIRLTSFIHSEILGSFATIFQHYHLSTFFMSFAMQNPSRLFILGFVLKSEATEG